MSSEKNKIANEKDAESGNGQETLSKSGETPAEEAPDDDSENKELQEDPEKEKLLKLIEEKDREIKELSNRCLRALADYDNVKKRTAREISNAIQSGCEDLVKKLLSVIDTFESALRHFGESNIDKKVLDGFEMLYIQFSDILEKEGLKPIKAKDEKFNPNLHEAIAKCNDPDKGDEIVTKEFEKGYLFKEKVIRPAKVEINQK